MKNVLITCTKTPFGKHLTEIFEREGYKVLGMDDFACAAAEDNKSLDFLVDTTNYTDPEDTFTLADGIKAEVIERVYRRNVIAPMKTLEAVLPFLDAGEGKRLFYVTGARASINGTRDVSGYAYNMSKAGLHQFLQMASNKLGPSGYTFRVYDPMDGVVDAKSAAEGAFHYITRRRGTENDDPRRDDENNLVLRDAEGRLHGW